MNLAHTLLVALFVISSVGCNSFERASSHTSKHALEISPTESKPASFKGLKHVVAFQDDLLSGSKPVGKFGMRSLERLNVKTIICVDGVAPDIEQARQHNIKTIHIPLKYNSPSKEQILDLTAAFKMGRNNGNVYLHCHHGKHRSAAAAAIISIALGLSTQEEMKGRMEVAETSPHYKGLWKAIEEQEAIDISNVLENMKSFPEAVIPNGMVEQMVTIDDAMERLLLVKQSGWVVPRSHPDLAPAADAGLIAEVLRSIQLNPNEAVSEADFTSQVINAVHQASGLEEALKIKKMNAKTLNQYFDHVEQSCIKCHRIFRD